MVLSFILGLFLLSTNIDGTVLTAKDASQDVLCNNAVVDWKKNDNILLTVSYEDGNLVSNGLQKLQPKNPSADVACNDEVAAWKQNSNEHMTISYSDGSKVSNGLQINPREDVAAAHQAAIDNAIAFGAGVVDNCQEHVAMQ